jgi:hypothetical protein
MRTIPQEAVVEAGGCKEASLSSASGNHYGSPIDTSEPHAFDFIAGVERRTNPACGWKDTGRR